MSLSDVLAGPLTPIGVLVLGAVVVLLLAGAIRDNALAAGLVGFPFAIAAGVVGDLVVPGGLAVLALCLVSALALLLIPVLEAEVPEHVVEAAALLLLGTAGAIGLAGATDLLQAVVGLETLALSAVTLVALGVGERALEAAFKYFVLGAISLAGLLFGVGLIYLSTGSFAFPAADRVTSNTLVLAGVVLVAMGFGFELAIFPFHWGALDAYTAAVPSAAGFVMSASKLAAAFALGRLVLAAGLPLAQLLVWVGCLTIVWGTFGALGQAANLRRMLAYSAVTHAGFIALALGCGPTGPATAAFYAAIYGSMAMLVFAALAGRGVDQIELSTLDRWRSVALGLGLFSLSGIPPTPGFWAKLAVLVVAWQFAGPLATLVAVAGGVFSVLYYLRPLPDLFSALRAEAPARPAPSLGSGPAVALAALVVALFGVLPNLVWAIAGH
jgi:NADH-quinone oxidoreductase subunit N